MDESLIINRIASKRKTTAEKVSEKQTHHLKKVGVGGAK